MWIRLEGTEAIMDYTGATMCLPACSCAHHPDERVHCSSSNAPPPPPWRDLHKDCLMFADCHMLLSTFAPVQAFCGRLCWSHLGG
jgi:hypothetical protein